MRKLPSLGEVSDKIEQQAHEDLGHPVRELATDEMLDVLLDAGERVVNKEDASNMRIVVRDEAVALIFKRSAILDDLGDTSNAAG